MLQQANIHVPGVVFTHNTDVTADMLNAMQQYLASELATRTQDFMLYPGFSYGLYVSSITGSYAVISKGSAIDQNGGRLYTTSDITFGLVSPSASVSVFYLCVKGVNTPATYIVNKYDGSKIPMESVLSLQFFTALNEDLHIDAAGHVYAPNNDGLVLAKISQSGDGFGWSDRVRSPILTMRC